MFVAHLALTYFVVVCYSILGVLFREVTLALFGPDRTLAAFAALLFFVGCAISHSELALHARELPDDFFTPTHVGLMFLQALGAGKFTYRTVREVL